MYIIYTMADKKISQFDTFPGAADDEVFFVVASGDADNPNASNYRYPFTNLTTDITNAGSAWVTETDLIYTLTGAVGLGTTDPIHQLDVATTGRFRSDLIVSGDLYVSGTTHINKIIDASITGTISGVTGEFADGIFADSLTISGNSVITGGSIEVPGGGGSVIGGDISNINFGGTEASDTRAVNFQVGGVDKLVIGSDGNVSISEDLTVSGNVSGAIISGRSGVFSHSLTVSGQPVLTGTSSSLGKWTDGAGGDIYYNGGNVGIGTTQPYHPLHVQTDQTETKIVVDNQGADNNTYGGWIGSNGDQNRKLHLGTKLNGLYETAMTIDSNGNVGIGNTNPIGPLHVSSPHSSDNTINLTRNVNITGITEHAASKIEGGALAGPSPSMGGAIGFALFDSDGTGPGADTEGYLYFETKDSGGGLTEKMRLASDGNVGIGTAFPEAYLHVSGSSASQYEAIFDNRAGNDGVMILAGNNGFGSERVLDVRKGNVAGDITGSIFNVNADGNVGIGTPTPAWLLDLEKKDGGVQLQMGRTNTNVGSTWMGSDGNGFHLGVGPYNAGGGTVSDPHGFTIDTNGALNASGEVRAPSGVFTEALTISGNSVLTGAAGSVGGQWTDVVGLPNIYYNAGFVGIGIEPTSKLHLYGTSNNYADIVSETDASRRIQHWFKNAAQSWSIGTNGTTSTPGNSFFIKDETLGLRRLSILTDGKVGIGVDSPTAKLHVTGGKILAPSGDFTESLTISGVPVSTGNGDGEPAFSSDARLKDDVYILSDSSEKIKQIRGVGFMWNENSSDGLRGREDVGVIAQEVQQILPSAVEEGSDGYLKVKYHRLIPLLLESVKDLQVENQKLQDRLNSAGL